MQAESFRYIRLGSKQDAQPGSQREQLGKAEAAIWMKLSVGCAAKEMVVTPHSARSWRGLLQLVREFRVHCRFVFL